MALGIEMLEEASKSAGDTIDLGEKVLSDDSHSQLLALFITRKDQGGLQGRRRRRNIRGCHLVRVYMCTGTALNKQLC